MPKINLSLVALILLTISCGKDPINPCPVGNGDFIPRVKEFDKGSLPVHYKIYPKSDILLVNSDSNQVRFRIEENLSDRFYYGGTDTFLIDYRDCILGHESLTVRILDPDPFMLSVFDSSQVQTENYRTTGLLIKAYDNSYSDLNLNGGSLKLILRDSSQFSMSGTLNQLKASIFNNAGLSASLCEKKAAFVTLASKHDIELWASDTLSVTFMSSANVYYKGDPVLLRRGSGTGRFIKLE